VQYNDPSQPPVTPPVNPPVDPPANPPVPSGGRTAANTGGSPDETSTVIDEPPLIDDMTSVDISEQALPESSGGETVPDVTIDADPRPGDLGGQSWALLNLILTVTAGSLLVVSIVGVVTARNRSSHSDMDAMDLPLSDHNGSSNGFDMQGVGFGSAHPADGFGTDGEYVDRADRHMFRKNIAVIAGLIGLLSAVILFVLTENMKRPMIIVNRYTIIYLVIVIAEIAFIALSRRRSPKAYR
jgi:hypothetical protein